ncbi:MAG: sulfotransferase family protein [Nanobdellota archaeon]
MGKVKTCLIGGTGRCGTNILKEILSSHSNAFSLPFEHRFTIDPRGVIDLYLGLKNNWSPYYTDYKIKNFESFMKSLSKRNTFKYYVSLFFKKFGFTPYPYYGWELSKWFENYDFHVNKLINNLKSFSFKGSWPGSQKLIKNNEIYFIEYNKDLKKYYNSFFNDIINDTLKKNNKKIFIEDNTWNILYSSELLSLIPNSKIIHMIRDPRDVVFSFLKQKWAPNSIEEAVSWYKSIMEKWDFEYKKLNKNYVKILKMEDLINKTESSLNEVCDFLDINIEDKMLNFDLSKGNIGKWKKMNKKDKDFLNKELKIYIKKFGY